MNILMLNPPFLERFSRVQRKPCRHQKRHIIFPYLACLYDGMLEKEGHCVKLIDAPAEGQSLVAVVKLTRDFKPQLTVLDTSMSSIYSDIKVAERFKKENPNCFITLVGTHVSVLPEETLRLNTSI